MTAIGSGVVGGRSVRDAKEKELGMWVRRQRALAGCSRGKWLSEPKRRMLVWWPGVEGRSRGHLGTRESSLVPSAGYIPRRLRKMETVEPAYQECLFAGGRPHQGSCPACPPGMGTLPCMPFSEMECARLWLKRCRSCHSSISAVAHCPLAPPYGRGRVEIHGIAV